jgi:hypothetical protein
MSIYTSISIHIAIFFFIYSSISLLPRCSPAPPPLSVAPPCEVRPSDITHTNTHKHIHTHTQNTHTHTINTTLGKHCNNTRRLSRSRLHARPDTQIISTSLLPHLPHCCFTVVALLLHCCYNSDTLLLRRLYRSRLYARSDKCYHMVTVLLQCCYSAVTVLLQCCCSTVTALFACSLPSLEVRPAENIHFPVTTLTTVITLLLHCCFVALLLNCCYSAGTLLLHGCITVATPLLN